MVIAALAIFAILFIAWLVAPSGERAAVEARPAALPSELLPDAG